MSRTIKPKIKYSLDTGFNACCFGSTTRNMYENIKAINLMVNGQISLHAKQVLDKVKTLFF